MYRITSSSLHALPLALVNVPCMYQVWLPLSTVIAGHRKVHWAVKTALKPSSCAKCINEKSYVYPSLYKPQSDLVDLCALCHGSVQLSLFSDCQSTWLSAGSLNGIIAHQLDACICCVSIINSSHYPKLYCPLHNVPHAVPVVTVSTTKHVLCAPVNECRICLRKSAVAQNPDHESAFVFITGEGLRRHNVWQYTKQPCSLSYHQVPSTNIHQLPTCHV